MPSIEDILRTFEPITLAQMDSVKLMDRTDTKYTFHISQLAEVLQLIHTDYRSLEIKERRIANYKTLYYDTSALELYTKHHNGKLNRYKIRHRTYVDSGLGFLEVKFKNNKGRTIKDRIKEITPLTHWDHNAAQFLDKKTPYTPADLVPTLWVNYSRITLVSRHTTERLTIDLNLEFVRNDNSKQLHQLVIAEVKQEKAGESKFIDAMKHLRIQEGSISKYCMAVAYTCDHAKKNGFKEKLLSIQKIIDYDVITDRR
ncbi:MAG: polyphosphate polymerase domain-containing protein [Bacteroidetes bacterium]|nr:polyphosphate polymerase domain-containing protein [Bacteroidota bacterium]